MGDGGRIILSVLDPRVYQKAIFHRENPRRENFTLYMRRKGRTLKPSPNCKFAKGEERTSLVHLFFQRLLRKTVKLGSTV